VKKAPTARPRNKPAPMAKSRHMAVMAQRISNYVSSMGGPFSEVFDRNFPRAVLMAEDYCKLKGERLTDVNSIAAQNAGWLKALEKEVRLRDRQFEARSPEDRLDAQLGRDAVVSPSMK